MQIDQHILIRYFLKQASEEEKEVIRQWIESSEDNRRRFIRERIRFDASILVDEAAVEPSTKIASGKRYRLHPALNWSFKVAASILILLGSFYLYDNYRMARLAQTLQCVYVPAGNRTNIQLPDGTSVWLNANTYLRYPMVFAENSREIMLDGEAYFEVAKDKKTFIVKTDKYDVEVLGTTFNVEAYKDKSNFRTMLYEGKVKLYNTKNQKAVYLSPGQTAELTGESLRVAPTTDPNSYRWKDGLIYIEDKSFNAIMELFEKFYDVRIIVNNKAVKDLGYRGKLRISDGGDHALRVLQNDFPFKYKWDEERNIIYIN